MTGTWRTRAIGSWVPQTARKPGSLYFAENEREWVHLKWGRIRDAMQQADTAVNKWERLSDEVNTYLDAHKITDIVQRTNIRGENLALSDALATGQWFRGVAQAHVDDLNLYLRLKELGLL